MQFLVRLSRDPAVADLFQYYASRLTAERLEEILLSMNEDPEGRSILERTDATTKFDPLPGGEEGMRRRLLETFYSPEKK